MQFILRFLNHFPRLKRLLKPVYYRVLLPLYHWLYSIYLRLQGISPVPDHNTSKQLIRDCVGKDDPVILEIGCNDGFHTLWFLEIFRNPTIYCFEPDPRAIERFRNTVGYPSNVHLFEMALSDYNGQAEFHQSGGQENNETAELMPLGWDKSGSLRRPKEHLIMHPWITYDQKITVSTSTMDDWSEQQGIGEIDFIWMDVQGAEIDVFRGGKNTLPRTRFLYTEYSNQELYEGQYSLKKLLQYLQHYDVMIKYPEDVLLRNRNFE